MSEVLEALEVARDLFSIIEELQASGALTPVQIQQVHDARHKYAAIVEAMPARNDA